MFVKTQIQFIMKKLFGLLTCLILLTAFTCDDEPLDSDFDINPDPNLSCEAALLNTANAALSFASATEDNYTALCTAYKTALQAQSLACGDEDGNIQTAIDALGDCTNDTVPNEGIVGTWLATSWISDEPVDINNDGEESTDLLAEFDCYNNETLVFNADNTGVMMSTSYADVEFEIETGTTDSYIYTVDCIEEVDNTNFTWTQNDNDITIIDEFDMETVWTLNGNQLSTLVPQGFIAFDSNDATVTVSQDLTFIYIRQ